MDKEKMNETELNCEEEKSIIKDETETQNMERVLLSDEDLSMVNAAGIPYVHQVEKKG